MTRAFVLSGGGSLGAVQVGMLQALAESGVIPDVLVGTSAGAVNAAWVAGHGMSSESLSELADLWRALRRHDVFPFSVPRVARGLLGGADSMCSADRFSELVRNHTGYDDMTDARIPVHVVAADLLGGAPVLLSTGPVSVAVQASAAVPGLFPPVVVDGRHLVDGGVAATGGVAPATGLGADEIYVLPTGTACALGQPPPTAVGVALHALTLLLERRLFTEVGEHSGRADGPPVRVLPPLCPLSIAASDFSHADELIRRARSASTQWLADGSCDLPHQERFLRPHAHRRAGAEVLGPSGRANRCETPHTPGARTAR